MTRLGSSLLQIVYAGHSRHFKHCIISLKNVVMITKDVKIEANFRDKRQSKRVKSKLLG